jgi:hypothetical protein
MLGVKFDREISYKMFRNNPKDRLVRVADHNFYDVKPEPGKVYVVEGLFESPHFYEERVEEILKSIDFSSKEPNSDKYNFWKEKILTTPVSCFVHVRRGDYGACGLPIEATLEFMDEMRKQKPDVHFFVFTDQPEVVKDHFKDVKDASFVSDGNLSSIEEFYLMRLTKNGVLSNSTFAYWVTETNLNRKEGLFIAPSPRINKVYISNFRTPFGEENDKKTLLIFLERPYPKRWKTIDVHNW